MFLVSKVINVQLPPACGLALPPATNPKKCLPSALFRQLQNSKQNNRGSRHWRNHVIDVPMEVAMCIECYPFTRADGDIISVSTWWRTGGAAGTWIWVLHRRNHWFWFDVIWYVCSGSNLSGMRHVNYHRTFCWTPCVECPLMSMIAEQQLIAQTVAWSVPLLACLNSNWLPSLLDKDIIRTWR